MNVGKDPFPRDEVTGLAKFENLEPVGSLSVVPESYEPDQEHQEHDEEHGQDHDQDPDQDPYPELAPGDLHGLSGFGSPRPDATLPLDLTAMQPSAAKTPATAPGRSSGLDAWFAEPAGMGWDDDEEATRVHTHPAGQTAQTAQAAHTAQAAAPQDARALSALDNAGVNVDWDDDEPPTQMQPFAMFETPPIAERHEWPEWQDVEHDETATTKPQAASAIRSATPTIRTATPPAHVNPPPQRRQVSPLTGGRPSPFPAPLPAAPLVPAPRSSNDDAIDPDAIGALASGRAANASQTAPGIQPATSSAAPGFQDSQGDRYQDYSESVDPLDDLAEPLSSTPERFLVALRSGHRPSLMLAGAVVAGLLLLVLIVRAIAAPRLGNAVVEVSPADARLQVDGDDVVGSGSPYSISELAPGTHQLVVTKSGYTGYHGSFAVGAGETTHPPVIELAPEVQEVGFSVRSIPEGAAVWIDGAASDEHTPARLTGIKPGIHRLQLKHAGFSDYELQLFVPEGTVLQLPVAELVALADGEDTEDGRGTDPELAPTRRWRARAARSSDDDADDSSWGRGSRRGRRHGNSDSVSERLATSARSSRSRRGTSSGGDDGDSAPAAAASSGKTGTLRLNTRPWSQVTVDGRVIGNTPQPNLELSAGKHKLLLVNQPLGMSKTLSVTVKPGETVTKVINLAQ